MIHWENVKIKIRNEVIVDQINLSLKKGESLGIIGRNGTGKTLVAKALAGQIPVWLNSENQTNTLSAVFVSFQSSLKIRNGFAAYRQQRWNNIDPDSVPTVREEINYINTPAVFHSLLETFDLAKHLNSYVISLSNGEQRKLELVRALATSPDLLVIDNAFNGLDNDSRDILSKMLNRLVKEKHSVILTGLSMEDFPESFLRFVFLQKGYPPEVVNKEKIFQPECFSEPFRIELPEWQNSPYFETFSIEGIQLNYLGKNILIDIFWTVNEGERWVLSGANGSGKTSLLNMIFADNPRAYGCKIRLFGNQKGSGESIWDIKKRIGFISPEMQQYLPPNQKALHVICSGFFDSEGLYIKPTSYQLSLARKWLEVVGDLSWSDRFFRDLSASEQRLILIARTLIKNPPLLLLDEPFQGLDRQTILKVSAILDSIARQTTCAMVFVTHLREEIPACFTLEMELKEGAVEYSGPVRK